MKKWLKYSLVALITVIVCLAIAIMAIVNFVNPNDYRDKISALASSALKEPVTIEGDLNWQFLPSFGLVVHGITVGSSGDTLYAHLETAKIAVRLWPLLSKQVEIKALNLDDLRIEKTINAGSSPVSNGAVAVAPALVAQEALTYLEHLDIQQVKIRHATLLLHNKLTAVDSRLSDGQLTLDHLANSQPCDFKLAFSYQADLLKNAQLALTWDGVLQIDAARQQIHCKNCQLQAIDTLESTKKIKLGLQADMLYGLTDRNLAITQIHGALDGFNYTAELHGNFADSQPKLHFVFEGATTQLRTSLENFGLAVATQDPHVLQVLNVKAEGSLAGGRLDVPQLTLHLDNSQISGKLHAIIAPQSSLATDLKLDQIDLGAYLKPQSQGRKLLLQHLSTQLQILLPNERQSLAFSGPIAFESLASDNLSLQAFSTLVDMKDHSLQLTKTQAQLLGGRYQGSSQVDFNSDVPKWAAMLNFTAIQIQPLLQLIDPSLSLSGQGDLSGNLSGEGVDSTHLVRNLDGHLKVAIRHGVLHGINIPYWIQSATAVLHRNTPPPLPAKNDTDFGNLTASLLINNGVVDNTDLLLISANAHVAGKGRIDLVQQRLDYHLDIDTKKTITGLTVVPLLIGGSFSQPLISLDLAALGRQALNQQITRHKGRLAELLAKHDQQLGQAVDQFIQKVDLNKLLASN